MKLNEIMQLVEEYRAAEGFPFEDMARDRLRAALAAPSPAEAPRAEVDGWHVENGRWFHERCDEYSPACGHAPPPAPAPKEE